MTWDEAFTYIAERMNKIKAEHGPESIVMFNHGVGVRFIQHVLKSWGAPASPALRSRSAGALATSASR